MKFTRPTAILLLTGLLALGAGCSSSKDDSAAGGGATTTAATGGAGDDGSSDKGGANGDEGGSPKAPDVCPDVDTAALEAAGVPTTGKASSFPAGPGAALGVCTFGGIADPKGFVTVQVAIKPADSTIDPVLTVLKAAVKTPPTDATKPAGAKVYDLAAIPGGGGIGKTVGWENDRYVVAASQTGENVDPAPLEDIVAGIAGKL